MASRSAPFLLLSNAYFDLRLDFGYFGGLFGKRGIVVLHPLDIYIQQLLLLSMA